MSAQSPFSRERAWSLLNEHTQSPSLLKHALAVETCVRAYAERQADASGLVGDDRDALLETWSATALLHDFDYEKHPSLEEHPFVGIAILTEQGWPEEMRTAILGHAEYSGVPRTTHLAKALFACDELAGFLTACSLVKPTKSIHDVEVAGVKKENEGQSLRPRRQSRRHRQRRSRTRRPPRRPHRLLHRRHARNAEALGLQGTPPQS